MLVYVISAPDASPQHFGDVCGALVADGHTIAQPSATAIDQMAMVRCDAVVVVGTPDDTVVSLCQQYRILLVAHKAGPLVLEPHMVVKRSPEQCLTFLEIVMAQYRLHLDKNADYSPANILGTGEVGVAVRLWDKIIRFMSLFGFNVAVSQSATYSPPREPKNESITDTLLDMANYAVIALILREGKWGK